MVDLAKGANYKLSDRFLSLCGTLWLAKELNREPCDAADGWQREFPAIYDFNISSW